MAGISSKAVGKIENKYKYNGIELDEDLGLNAYEAYYRILDPAIGRWWQIDPKIEEGQVNLSPYTSMANDPMKLSDPRGDVPCCKEVWADIKDVGKQTWSSVKEGASAVYSGAVNVARAVNQVNPLASAVEVITGKSSASDFTEDKSRLSAVADLSVNTVMLFTGEVGMTMKGESALLRGAKLETAGGESMASGNNATVYERVMSNAELKATKGEGGVNMLRGGRKGENFFSLKGTISNDAKRAQQRLGLDGELRTHKVEFSLKNNNQIVNGPRTAKAGKTGTSGGGLEYSTNQTTPIDIKRIIPLKNTGQ